MSSSGKSKRKVKGKTLDLNTFLGEDQDAPTGFAVVRCTDWADVMENEDMDERYTSDYKKDEKIVLPTAPKAARGPAVDLSKVPTKSPFTAFLGNLPYDVAEEDIIRFFRKLKVTNVRLPREGGERGRIRGFGYAEFEDRQSLIEALSLDNETLKNRIIKVSLAGEHDNDRDRRDDKNDRTAGDWRAAAREESFTREDRQKNGSQSGQYNRGYMDREPFRTRNYDRDFGYNRDNYGRDRYNRNERGYNNDRFDRNDRIYSSDRDWDRGYPDKDKGYNRQYGERNYEPTERGYERNSRGGGSGRRDFGSGFRDGQDKWRDEKDRGGYERRDSFERRNNYERREDKEQEQDLPKERPRLQLKPRTVPLEQKNAPANTSSASAIFGGAKPVDTSAREREIEERLAKEKEKIETQVRDQRERTEEPRSRRFSTGSGLSNRSRRSSESGSVAPFRDSFSEDDSLPTGRPPVPRQPVMENNQCNTLPRIRQRRSSVGSTGSDRENSWNSRDGRPPSGRWKDENNDNSISKRENSPDKSLNRQNQTNMEVRRVERSNCSTNRISKNISRINQRPRHDNSKERSPRMPTYEEPKPPVYTSANKFSHLMNEEDIDRGSTSD